MECSEWIAIADIIVSIALGIFLIIVIQNNYEKSRCLRNFFISELKTLESEYRTFCNEICYGNISAKEITTRLKTFSQRISNIERSINSKFKIKSLKIGELHTKLQQEITYLDDFNSQFNNSHISLSTSSIKLVINNFELLSNSIITCVIEVNEVKIK